jgi:predicted exporter
VSVLQALGSTVGLGAVLALVFSAILAAPPEQLKVNSNNPN